MNNVKGILIIRKDGIIMGFAKNFIITPDNGLTLINTIDRDVYLREKVDYFSIYENYTSKVERLGLIQEILDMYNTDCTSATFDISPIAGFRLFDINDHRKIMLMYYDIIFILGTIFLNVFDLPRLRLDHVEDGLNGPVSTATMLLTAYNDLLNCKVTNKTPYGANLIFATILEKDMKSVVKIACAREWLIALNQAIQNGIVTLSPSEADLFAFLLYDYGLTTTPCNIIFDSVIATTTAFYDLLIKYTIIRTTDKEAENLLLNKFTLNQFLNTTISQSKIEAPFIELVKLLFGSSNLNLRNNLAHCNFGYLNYHTICVAALLYSLISMVSDGQCLK